MINAIVPSGTAVDLLAHGLFAGLLAGLFGASAEELSARGGRR